MVYVACCQRWPRAAPQQILTSIVKTLYRLTYYDAGHVGTYHPAQHSAGSSLCRCCCCCMLLHEPLTDTAVTAANADCSNSSNDAWITVTSAAWDITLHTTIIEVTTNDSWFQVALYVVSLLELQGRPKNRTTSFHLVIIFLHHFSHSVCIVISLFC